MSFWPVSIILPALFLGILEAQAKPRLVQPAETAFQRSCSDSYALFEAKIAERRARENPVYDKEARIRARYGAFQEINDSDNAHFVRLAERANLGQSTEAKLFLDLENAVLKELNDKVVQDKDLVTALTNLHKDVVWASISSDPDIMKHLVGKYSDFKSVRLAFDTTSPELKRKLESKLIDINKRYSEYLASLSAQSGWQARARGLARDGRSWYHSGIGASADEAGLATRDSRTVAGPARLRAFSASRENLQRAVREAGLFQKWAESRFRALPGFLADAGGGRKVLSAEAIEAIRKVSPKAETNEAFAEAIQLVLKHRFGAEVSAREALALRQYLNTVDRFSPGLLLDKRVVIDMGKDAAGVISADFKGQNARNLEETMKALSRSQGRPLDEIVREVRKGEIIATESLEAKKARFQQVLERLVPGAKAEFSGDDGIGFLATPLTKEQRRLFARYWKEAGGQAEDLRLTFEEFRYADTGAVIPAELRSPLVVAAEGAEKKLRAELIRVLPREDLNALHIAVSLEARERGGNSAVVHLAPNRPLPAGIAAKVREILRREGLSVSEVEIIP